MNGDRARLVVFAGLPGVGKSTLAREVARALGATLLRTDTISTAIAFPTTAFKDDRVGLVVGARIVAEQLRVGGSVVVDADTASEDVRLGWVKTSRKYAAVLDFVEVTCDDLDEHRRRVESLVAEVHGQFIPTWADVRAWRWQPFSVDRIVIDSSGDTAESVRRVLDRLTG